MTVRNRAEIVIAKVKVVTTQDIITSRVVVGISLARVVVDTTKPEEEATSRVRVAVVDIIKVVKAEVVVISLVTMTIIKAVAHLVKIIEIREIMMVDILAHHNVVTYLEAIAAEVVAVAHLKAAADTGEGIIVVVAEVISHVVHSIQEDSIRIALQERTAIRTMTIMATNAHRKIKNRPQKNGLLLLREQAI